MTKSEVALLQGVMESLLKDYITCYPSDAEEVERDKTRLSLLAQTRGLGVFLLDLPALGKHFDRCLSSGAYVNPNLPLSSVRWNDSELPSLFSGILVRVFERISGSLRSDVDVTAVAFLRQFYYFAKDYEHACSRPRAASAVKEFYAIERELRSPSLNWGDDRINLWDAHQLHFGDAVGYPGYGRPPSGEPDELREVSNQLDCLQRVCDIVIGSWRKFRPEEYYPRHGPGAVSDLSRKLSKYSFPNWSEKLEGVFPYALMAFLNYMEWVDSVQDDDDYELEPPSNLLMVPKTAKGPRLIASEPVAHQWCQQTVLQYIVAQIGSTALRSCIDLNDQEPSRRLTLRASKSGSHATIDLSSASDRVTCWAVERAFRVSPEFLEALHASRTRFVKNMTGMEVGEFPEIHIKKFSTQGSACTFPVQSVLFSLVAISAVLYGSGALVYPATIRWAARQVRVFGDDIIVPTKYYRQVTDLLSVVGLKVNDSKSFHEGNFRESCGMDAFMGHDVTPAHVNTQVDKTRPSSVVSSLDASNNFFMKGYWNTAEFIKSTLPQWVLSCTPVVEVGSGCPGLKSFVGSDIRHLAKRTNKDLQRTEVRTLRLINRSGTYPQSGRHDVFQYFIDRPNPEKVWEPGRRRDASLYLRRAWEPVGSYVCNKQA